MTQAEADQVAGLLAKLEPGFLPGPIFHQFARLAALPIVELVPLRINGGKTEVLLLARPDDDPVWPGEFHTPGTVVRGSDRSPLDAIGRILQDELGLPTDTPVEFALSCMHHSGRGMEVAQVYWLDVTGLAVDGQFYDVDALPAKFAQSQLDFLPQTVAAFRAAN